VARVWGVLAQARCASTDGVHLSAVSTDRCCCSENTCSAIQSSRLESGLVLVRARAPRHVTEPESDNRCRIHDATEVPSAGW